MGKFLKLPLSRLHVLFFVLEATGIFCMVILASSIRTGSVPRDLDFFIHQGLYQKAALVTTICMVVLHYHDLLYDTIQLRHRWIGLQIIQAHSISTLILFGLYYLVPDLALGRGIFFMAMSMIAVVSIATRLLYFHLTNNPNFCENTLIIGSQGLARLVGKELMKRADLGYRITGFIDDNPDLLGKTVLNPKVIGTYSDVGKIVKNRKVQTVIVALPDRRGKLPVQALLQCKLQGINILDGISFYENVCGKIALEGLQPSCLIFSDGFSRPTTGKVTKRIMDITFSLFALLTMIPLFPLVALLIKIDSPGPVFYAQQRVGAKGQLFTLLKFRSMELDAEKDTGPAWAKKNDPRVTRVGRFIRKMRIDELPQVWNIVRGEMSLVGPRPERPHFDKELGDGLPYYTLRLSVKPGITGWAQVRYQYGASVDDSIEKLQYDLYYIKHLSVLFDLIIIFETIKIVLLGKGGR